MGQASKQQQILYRVKRGETLSRIANKHNVTIADIREWNKGIGTACARGRRSNWSLTPTRFNIGS